MRRLLLFIALLTSITSFSAPWNTAVIQEQVKTLPNINYVGAYVWNAKYTPSGSQELVTTVYLDGLTGTSWSRVTVSVYGRYRKTRLGWPQVYWEWGYKEFTTDIAPNTSGGWQSHYIHSTDSFNMSGVPTADGQGEGLASGQVTLVSFVEI